MRKSFPLILTIVVLMPIMALPSYIVRFEVFGYPSTLLEVLIITAGVVAVAQLGVYKFLVLVRALPRWFLWSTLGLTVASVMAVIVSSDFIHALGEVRAYIWEPMIYTILLYCLFARRLVNLRQILFALVVPIVFLVVLSFWQKISGVNSFAPQQALQGRISAVYNSANALALFLVPCLGILWSLLISKKTLLTRLLTLVLIIGLCFTLIFSKSEAGIAAAVISSVIFWLLWIGHAKVPNTLIKKLLSISFILGVVLTLGFMLLIVSRLTPKFDTVPLTRMVKSTFEVRLCLWEGSVGMLRAQPLFGSGMAGFQDAYKEFMTCDNEPLLYAHNMFLDMWISLGILGLFAYLMLIYQSMRVVLERFLEKKNAIALGVFCSFVGYLLHGLFDVPYFKNDLALLFWILVLFALIVGLSLKDE